ANVAVACAGRPAGASVTAPSNPGARVTVTSTVALEPVSTGSLSADSASWNDASGVGSGSPGCAAPPPPPQACASSARDAKRVVRTADGTSFDCDVMAADLLSGVGCLGYRSGANDEFVTPPKYRARTGPLATCSLASR